jgi:hypothetical protein
LPAKKQPLKAKLKSWQLIAAVVSSVSVVAAGVGVFAYQSYTQSQEAAGSSAESAIELGEQRFEELSDLIDNLELAIRNSEETVVNTDGQTLEEQERDDLVAEIEASKQVWVEQKTKLLELEAAVKSLKNQLAAATPSRESLILLTREIIEIANSDWGPITTQVVALGERIGSVETAQEAWKKEQERIIAAETAERLAKARAAPSVSTITEEGGSSAVTSPAPPAANAPPKQGPTSEAFNSSVLQARQDGLNLVAFIESYIRELAANVVFDWSNDRLCDSRYICGQAEVGISLDYLEAEFPELIPTLPSGFPVEQVVIIRLDPRIIDLYLSDDGIGRFVLVHEAAHARQWLKYGAGIIDANQAYTAGVPASTRWPQGVSGKDSVEYMADCMSISYLGYFVEGSYTTSCTPEQLSAANAVW